MKIHIELTPDAADDFTASIINGATQLDSGYQFQYLNHVYITNFINMWVRQQDNLRYEEWVVIEPCIEDTLKSFLQDMGIWFDL